MQQCDVRPLGRRHDVGWVAVTLSMACVPAGRRHGPCAQRHLGAVCGWLSLVEVVRY